MSTETILSQASHKSSAVARHQRVSQAVAATFEPLERRELMSASLVAGQLTIDGTAGGDTITVKQTSTQVIVSDNGAASAWSLAGVRTIVINGNAGNDQLLADATVTRKIIARGDAGQDTIRGGSAGDRLYGGDNNDDIDGGAGNDGLFGGVNGADRLTGGPGGDLFLVQGVRLTVGATLIFATNETITDSSAEDARIQLTSTDKAWTDAEVMQMDKGLAFLMQATGNTKLMKLSTGGELQFQRVSSLSSAPGVTTLGDNDSAGRIRVTDGSIGGMDTNIVHELGHNWDTENPLYDSFKALSSWRTLAVDKTVPLGFRRARDLSGAAQPWIYRSSTKFGRPDGYGRTSPLEDFATSLETYYSGLNAAANWQAKYNFIGSFLKGMQFDIYGEIGRYYSLTPIIPDAYGRSLRGVLGFATGAERDVPGIAGARMQTFQGGTIYWSAATGTHAVYGAIGDLYRRTASMTDSAGKSVQSILGLPTSEEQNTPGIAGGRKQVFQNGTIYWSERTGAHVVYGLIGQKHNQTASMTDANGNNLMTLLGLPTSDEVAVPGRPGARMNTFEHGTIYWSPSTGAHVVYGAIGGLYASLGGAAGSLGLPISDEEGLLRSIRVSRFEHGTIAWTASSGAWVV